MQKVRNICFGLSTVFLFHFVWEMAHAGLYAPHFFGQTDFVLVHLRAALGDVALTGLLYIVGVAVFRDMRWFLAKGFQPHVFVVCSSLFISIVIEQFALLSKRWVYSPLMPQIPFVHVGISPVAQLTVISFCALLLFRLIFKQTNKNRF